MLARLGQPGRGICLFPSCHFSRHPFQLPLLILRVFATKNQQHQQVSEATSRSLVCQLRMWFDFRLQSTACHEFAQAKRSPINQNLEIDKYQCTHFLITVQEAHGACYQWISGAASWALYCSEMSGRSRKRRVRIHTKSFASDWTGMLLKWTGWTGFRWKKLFRLVKTHQCQQLPFSHALISLPIRHVQHCPAMIARFENNCLQSVQQPSFSCFLFSITTAPPVQRCQHTHFPLLFIVFALFFFCFLVPHLPGDGS